MVLVELAENLTELSQSYCRRCWYTHTHIYIYGATAGQTKPSILLQGLISKKRATDKVFFLSCVKMAS